VAQLFLKIAKFGGTEHANANDYNRFHVPVTPGTRLGQAGDKRAFESNLSLRLASCNTVPQKLLKTAEQSPFLLGVISGMHYGEAGLFVRSVKLLKEAALLKESQKSIVLSNQQTLYFGIQPI
jgi:hypothetical protein